MQAVARRSGTLGSGAKLARIVADRIVSDIAAAGWPVGTVVGSETELRHRYGVSRAVFREAVRLVEGRQVARNRRGRGGGLVVTEPTVDAAVDAAVLYLHRVGARLDEVLEARVVVEQIACELAPSYLDERGIAALRALVERESTGIERDHRALHTLLAGITGNPALVLFVEMLTSVTDLYVRRPRRLGPAAVGAATNAHARVVDAVLAGDGSLAKHRMTGHLIAEVDYLRRRRSTSQKLDWNAFGSIVPDGKRAGVVARRIFTEVMAAGMEPGDLIGSEAEMMAAHGVTRDVLREAIRLLEHHQVAAMRPGRGGGLFVAPPSVDAVSDAVAVYLERQGIQTAQLMELRIGIELAIADRVTERPPEDVSDALHIALAEEHALPDEVALMGTDELHTALATLSGNRVLELGALVLVRLSRLHQQRQPPSRRALAEIRADIHRAHAGIVAAIESGDRDLARHRARRHLEAVRAYMR